MSRLTPMSPIDYREHLASDKSFLFNDFVDPEGKKCIPNAFFGLI